MRPEPIETHMQPTPDTARLAAVHVIFTAATALVEHLEKGRPIDRTALRAAMTDAAGDTDAAGAWTWKQAYDAAETALSLLVQRYGCAMFRRAGSPAAMHDLLARTARLEPPQTRRDDTQQRFQQFSTPLLLAWTAAAAAAVRPDDVVLEPSAGTGTLATLAAIGIDPEQGGQLVLNELASTRAGLLARIFPKTAVTRHDAEMIADLLPDASPSAVVMNPPFSRAASITTRRTGTDLRHIRSAYQAMRGGGRLVALTSSNCRPGDPDWRYVFDRVTPRPDVLWTRPLAGRLYRSRGTNFETRLTILEKPLPDDPLPAWTARHDTDTPATDTADLLADVLGRTATRRTPAPRPAPVANPVNVPRGRHSRNRRLTRTLPPHNWGPLTDLEYQPASSAPDTTKADAAAPYHAWRPATVIVPGATNHPTPLVQSAAMAAVSHRRPSARPRLPVATVNSGALSDAQLESIVLACDATSRTLAGSYEMTTDWDRLRLVGTHEEDEEGLTWSRPTEIRQGWMLGDGTGCGKGRQVAALILERWLRGTRRALWLSQSDKLIEDARRDWRALRGRDDDIVSVNTWRQKDDVALREGILFATYATLRSAPRNGSQSRLDQIIKWLAGSTAETDRHRFDGLVVFDEAHAMANSTGRKGSRGRIAPSQQGRAGMRLQNALPQARVIYVSATGASTISGLCYANRLGLWSTETTPFQTRSDFVQAMESGGVAAMEIVARDLKAMGRYQARALAYSGVEVDILQHPLTDEQTRIYNEYADTFKIIHANLETALAIVGLDNGASTALAKAAAKSAFESAKQRFFGHLLTSMKCPTLLQAIENDLRAARAPVIQLVSTGEALTQRRIAEIPTSDWDDLNIDLTPREYVLDYLARAFPIHLHEEYEDEDGNILTRPVKDEKGNPVANRQAVALRDQLIERLGALPAINAALDQLIQHLGHDQVAEVSGRSRRVLRIDDGAGSRLAVRPRSPSANILETRAFMAGEKRVLVFSGAGNTGRSYHADKSCGNTARRVHYLLEAGWRADQAVQGLGRTHRTHQASAPVFRPVTTDVKGERRFTSTIARRMDSLGALTRGQRDSQTRFGDGRLFDERDNFDSPYAHAALRQFYGDVYHGRLDNWPLDAFEQATGLRLTDHEGQLLANPPPMSTFLNRLLALRIHEQNDLFEHLETLVDAAIQDAVDAGTYNVGVERITAASLQIASRHQAPQTDTDYGSPTELVEITRQDRVHPLTAAQALELRDHERSRKRNPHFLWNSHSGHVALSIPTASRTLEDGTVQKRRRLIRPLTRRTIPLDDLNAPGTGWQKTTLDRWRKTWEAECAALPEHETSHFWLVTGILLTIWTKLPDTDVRVYRLTTDAGENLIGRVLTRGQVETVRAILGIDATEETEPSPAERMTELLNRESRYVLQNGIVLAGRRHMGLIRVEIDNIPYGLPDILKRLGCQSEIVQYRTRLFVPDAETLDRLLDRHPIAQRTAAFATPATGTA